MMSVFFYLQPTLNRLRSNYLKLNWYWINFPWNMKGGVKLNPPEKTTFKKLSFIRIIRHKSKYVNMSNPFVPNARFLYPLKTSENPEVFWCFQGVEKGCVENEQVKKIWLNMIRNLNVSTLFLVSSSFLFKMQFFFEKSKSKFRITIYDSSLNYLGAFCSISLEIKDCLIRNVLEK